MIDVTKWSVICLLSSTGSATSRWILVPFERYGCPKKCAQKSSVTLFPHIFHIKPKWTIVYKYFKTKIFSRDFPKCIKYQMFLGTSLKLLGGFEVSLNYLILNFKKMVCPKNVWMRHWQVMINVTKWSFICLLSSDQCFVITPSQFIELFSLKLAYLKFLFLLF